MRSNIWKKLRSKKGFTLLELIVVMAVIAILVLLAQSAFSGYAELARVRHIQHDIKAAENILEPYLYNDHTHIRSFPEVAEVSYEESMSEGLLYDKRGLVTERGMEKVLYDISEAGAIHDLRSKLKGRFLANEDGVVFYVLDAIHLEDTSSGPLPGPDPLDHEWFTYTIEDGRVTVTGITPEGNAHFQGNIVIPSSLSSLPVDKVGDGAFDRLSGSYPALYHRIKSVTVSEGVREIGERSFRYNHITELSLPSTLRIIGSGAFQLNSLTEVSFPYGLEQIGGNAFRSNRLQQAHIPDSVLFIGDHSFSSNNIRSLYLSNQLPRIPYGAFSNNEFETVLIPSSVKTIENSAFINGELRTVEIPGTVESVDSHAFYNNNIQSLTLHEGLTNVARSAFSSNRIGSLHIPSTVKRISDNAFQENLIESLTLEQGVEWIGVGAFRYNNIKALSIPDSVTTIDQMAFNWNSLESVYIGRGTTGIIGENPFSRNPTLSIMIVHPENIRYESINNAIYQIAPGIYGRVLVSGTSGMAHHIPGWVGNIGQAAFRGMGLASVTIPEGVRRISQDAFNDNHIQEVHLPDSLESLGVHPFSPDIQRVRIPEGVSIPNSSIRYLGQFYADQGKAEGVYVQASDFIWIRE